MMTKVIFTTIIVLLSLLLSMECRANSSKKELYELQERCGQRAEQVFKDKYAVLSGSRNYENHYNSRLNKCFIHVYDTAAEYLLDVNENEESMYIFRDGRCIIEGNFCKNLKEWDAFVKDKMEKLK